MDREKLKTFYTKAKDYAEQNHPEDLFWAKGVSPDTFKNLKAHEFLEHYCWVVYASGFKVAIVKMKFEKLERAFKGFDLDKLSRTRSVQPALKIINHERKALGFLEGAKKIHKEGFSNFKKRLKSGGMGVLKELPYIGEVTQKHLAKNIGLEDTAKDDVWLVRIKECFHALDVREVTSYLSEESKDSQHVVDLILWVYCANNAGVLKSPI